MNSPLIDTHCHLDADAFDADRDAVIAQAQAVGVVQQIVPAVGAWNWEKVKTVCQSKKHLYPAYGLHPMYIDKHRPEHLESLRDWIEKEKPCAIGECGLDYYISDKNADQQQSYFMTQLRLAKTYDLPVIIHARRAMDAVIAAIRSVGDVRGVIHSFSGSEEQAQRLARLGFLIGLGGPVTYERANRLRRIAAAIPVEQLVLETDSPDQPDSGIRGQRNTPARLTFILEVIARLRHQSISDVAEQTTINARALFGLSSV